MIKLYDLLLEATQGKPKAIFLAGPAGSGKSFISKKIIPSSYTTINVDDTYEELLKKAGIGLKQKDFGLDQNTAAGKLMAQARKDTQDKFNDKISKKQNVVIDSVAAASAPVQKKKSELEALGYECIMVMIYVNPLTSLERNKQRDRSLLPGIVLRTWHSVNTNINVYRKMFGDKFYIINNDPNIDAEFSKEKIEPYLKDSNPNAGKQKSPEEIAKSKAEKDKINKEIEAMVKTLPKFDSIDSVKAIINTK
jgi:dephospho-CoA kinase